tara:strand:+ start:3504 stop:4055 length:552 start_codon:yes stop_codon:yes gene_type:complete
MNSAIFLVMFHANYNTGRLGQCMAECEVCGAMKISTRSVLMGKANVSACQRCIEKLGLAPKQDAPGIRMAKSRPRTSFNSKKRGDIMATQEKELVDDFAARIVSGRENKGWNQNELGKRMAETVNVIKSAESGKPPTDSVVNKLERVLGITLMEVRKPSETSRVSTGTVRGMTLGDFLNQSGE